MAMDIGDDPKIEVTLGELITVGVSVAVMSGGDPEDVRRVFRRMADNEEFWAMVGKVRPITERLADEVMGEQDEEDSSPGLLS